MSSADLVTYGQVNFTSTTHTTTNVHMLELDAEGHSYDKHTLRSIRVPQLIAALLGTCRRMRVEGLKQMYKANTLAITPKALSLPSFLLPGHLPQYITKLHLNLTVPRLHADITAYGHGHAAPRVFPLLINATEMLSLLPRLRTVTFALGSRFLWGLVRSNFRDKRKASEILADDTLDHTFDGALIAAAKSEAVPLCQLTDLPDNEAYLDGPSWGHAVPKRMPLRYNHDTFMLMQADQELVVQMNFLVGKPNRSNRKILHNANTDKAGATDLLVALQHSQLDGAGDPKILYAPHFCNNVLCNVLCMIEDTVAVKVDYNDQEPAINESGPANRQMRRFHNPAWVEHIHSIQLENCDYMIDIYRPEEDKEDLPIKSKNGKLNKSNRRKPKPVKPKHRKWSKAEESLFATGLRIQQDWVSGRWGKQA